MNKSFFLLVFTLLCGSCSRAPINQDTEKQEKFQGFNLGGPYVAARAFPDDHGQVEVFSKSFRPGSEKGSKVTLVGMIHVGSQAYYEQVQNLIDGASYVFFENIGEVKIDEETKKVRYTDPFWKHILGDSNCTKFVQIYLMSSGDPQNQNDGFWLQSLGLKFQRDQLTFPPHNSVWTDLAFESILDQILRVPFADRHKEELEMISQDSKCERAVWLFEEAQRNSLEPKILLGGGRNETIARIINTDQVKDTIPGYTKVLLNQRNDVVLGKLDELLPTLSEGEIVVVYGAAHMQDIERRFLERHSYVPDVEKRLVAFEY